MRALAVRVALLGPLIVPAVAEAAGAAAVPRGAASLALPGHGRLQSVSLHKGALLIVDLEPLAAKASELAPPAHLSLRVEYLPAGRLRLKFVAEDGGCLPRLQGRSIVCRTITEAESRERVSAMVGEPLDVGGSESASDAVEAERLLAAGDFEGAAARYTRLRRVYSMRGVAELRLADLRWLGGTAGDAVAEWGRVAVRFRRRAEGRIAALRAAAAAWFLEGATPASLPEPESADVPYSSDAALARAHLLGGLGRFEDALEAIRGTTSPALQPSLDRLRTGLLGAGIRLTSIRGQAMRTVLLFRRNFDFVRTHPDRVDLELATADALLDLDLVQEAIEVVEDALTAAVGNGEQARVGAWIDRVRASLVSAPSPAPEVSAAHPLAARLASLKSEVDATLRIAQVRP